MQVPLRYLNQDIDLLKNLIPIAASLADESGVVNPEFAEKKLSGI
jgi:hypothetical protein